MQQSQAPQGPGQTGTPGHPKPVMPLQGPGHSGTPQQQGRAGVTGGAGPPKQATPQGGPSGSSSFSAQQLAVLRNQIFAFRRIKRGERSLPADLLAGIKPPPLPKTAPQSRPAGALTAPSPNVATTSKPIQATTSKPIQAPVPAAAAHHAAQPLVPPVSSAARPALPLVPPAAAAPRPALLVVPPALAAAAAAVRPAAPVVPPALAAAVRPALPGVPPAGAPAAAAAAVARPPQAASPAGVPLPAGQPASAPALPAPPTGLPAASPASPVVKDATPPPQAPGTPPPVQRKDRAPMYSLVSGPRHAAYTPRPPAPGCLPAGQLQYDVAAMMAAEFQSRLRRQMAARAAELERLLNAPVGEGPGPGERAVLKLELLKLRAVDRQRQLRLALERQQEEIMNMNDRAYRKFARTTQRQRLDRIKAEEKAKMELAAERAKAIKQWRADMAERSLLTRELRIARNRAVARIHDRLAREHNKAKDDDRTRRMEALKANDWEAYQELLRQQMGPETTGERYEVIARFLTETEEYLHKLASKVASVRLSQQAMEAASAAVADAQAQGLAEEEVKEAARLAAQEAVDLSDVVRGNKGAGDAQSRYYGLAHSVQEIVRSQPALLRPPGNARLREYQMVGLQWMVSLYNNHLNGILADEMGLGKTVQVMALIAYLMEHKNNYGPHLIIVPNAVMVNWKSELTQWLPAVRCVYYVGAKEERARKFNQEVSSLQFNVLVTTYEYIMRDRTRLSKVAWKYIIIDEAQRMKDRQSKLAKDLDRFQSQRRLLLTGTPLQNELKELWSLLNLLLPEVFDDKAMFAEWFGDALGKQGAEGSADEWLEKEKRVVIIHRLHQILEPFMLRRQVQDVESKLPEKVAVVLKVAMRPFQSVVYQWVKNTGTLRLDPAAAVLRPHGRAYAPLNNKCMELRKVCNHPALSYPLTYSLDPEDLIRHCGKMAVLDRLLVKFFKTGHRILLFSTMTRLLDLLELYLRWRRVPGPDGEPTTMGYLRIDGSTALEDREVAIQRFNEPKSSAFIFLLSIRAAGRGLNLQAADTVIIYDPDPNPKNEEQAIARSHRIGQTKEVRVVHLEAVADAPAHGGASVAAQAEEWTHPERNYADSIESLVRNNIQKMKIDMANEVIDAGRFDMQTTMEERKQTLEALLQDEERMKKAVNVVPGHDEINAWLARSPEELETFKRLDAELDWPAESQGLGDIPAFLQYTEQDLGEAIAATSKVKPSQAASRANLAALAPQPQYQAVQDAEARADAAPLAVPQPVEPAPLPLVPAAAPIRKLKLRFRLPGAGPGASTPSMSSALTNSRKDSEASVSVSDGGATTTGGNDPGEMEEEVIGANVILEDDIMLPPPTRLPKGPTPPPLTALASTGGSLPSEGKRETPPSGGLPPPKKQKRESSPSHPSIKQEAASLPQRDAGLYSAPTPEAKPGNSGAGKPSVVFKLGARPGVPAVTQEDASPLRDGLPQAEAPQVPRDSHGNAPWDTGGEVQCTGEEAKPGVPQTPAAGIVKQEGEGKNGEREGPMVPSGTGGRQGTAGWTEDPRSSGGQVSGQKHERDGAGEVQGLRGDRQMGATAGSGTSQGPGESRDRQEGPNGERGEVGEPPPQKKLKIKFKFPIAKSGQ